jgi:branched-chain amino acid transport system ATP-binding protein
VTSSGPSTAGAILRFQDVEAGYGPFRALFGVSFSIAEGHALALVGANGAGKTTVARVCSGLVRPTSGRVVFDGVDLATRRVFEIAGMGVVQAPEGRSVFASLTVEENLTLSFRRSVGRHGVTDALDEAFEAFPRLGERRRQAAGTLSGGEQRMLSLARVLVDPPRLLVADELSLGLAPIVVDEVYRTLDRIRTAGTTLLIVEQQIGHALDLADDALVLTQGRVSFAGPAADLTGLHSTLALGADPASLPTTPAPPNRNPENQP